MLNALEEKLSRLDESPSGPTTLELFSECLLNRLAPIGSEAYVESITELTAKQEKLLESLGLGHLTRKKYLNKLLEYSTV
ncbi:MAG: hypothetical protein C4554_11020 [Dethiobacter sp.]|nr:MAG: hypothetical protein C4554_11020 [Dethiobacter sp.]